ncbi:MAG: biopolymer transporter ExbD [Planctomycetaceae bacterium]|nr:MAG: biopolymer transporter ExbD [Planctomycetaceae bacterium]
MKVRNRQEAVKHEVNMTSMIDIVFLLLVFFVMTFKIVEMEGDFSVRMPLASDESGAVDDTELPIKLRLRADDSGMLTSIQLNEISLGVDFASLQNTVIGLVGSAVPGDDAGEGPEIEIDTDFHLRYEHVIESITAVSGYKEGDQTVKLIEKIKFAKPRR